MIDGQLFPRPQRVPPKVHKHDTLTYTKGVTYNMWLGGGWKNDVWVWITGGIILAEENKGTGKKTCHSATLSSTISTRNGLGTNPSLRVRKSGQHAWRTARLNAEYQLITYYSCRPRHIEHDSFLIRIFYFPSWREYWGSNFWGKEKHQSWLNFRPLIDSVSLRQGFNLSTLNVLS